MVLRYKTHVPMIYTVMWGGGPGERPRPGQLDWTSPPPPNFSLRSQSQVSQSHRNSLHFSMTDHFSGAVTAPAERAAATKTASPPRFCWRRLDPDPGRRRQTEGSGWIFTGRQRSRDKAEEAKAWQQKQSRRVLKYLISKKKVHNKQT